MTIDASEPRDPLWRAIALLDLSRRRAALAILLGTLGLGCAVALAAVAAWLIARASQMPPVMELSVAAVSVRAFGIGRGVLRYVERIVSHDLALRGMTNLREHVYSTLASGSPTAGLQLRRGTLLSRVGADVDDVGDAVVRGLLPIGVAGVLGLGTVIAMTSLLPAAGLSLAACLLLAGLAAPVLASRAARDATHDSAGARARMSAAALTILDDATELTVSGRLADRVADLRRAEHELIASTDRAARPAAWAAAIAPLAQGLAVVAALGFGVPAVATGALSPVALAVIVLTPLAAFEASSLLPGAAVQLVRSRDAARRILALLDEASAPAPSATGDIAIRSGEGLTHLSARGLAWGWPGQHFLGADLDLDVGPGRAVAVVGPSGVGKTTLLLTLAGLLPCIAGHIDLRVPWPRTPGATTEQETRRAVVHLAEDAHVFATTVLENLRVARGDVTAEQAIQALERVALGPWFSGLPDGLDTLLGPDALTISGGERRRLLLARALLAPADVLLVDEPAEHLDAATADALVADLLGTARAQERGVVIVTHRLSALGGADEVILLDGDRMVARGTHASLLERVPAYRKAWQREQRGLDDGHELEQEHP